MFYDSIREEELKNKVAKDWFGVFDGTKIVGNVDFCITFPSNGRQADLFETESLLWAEAKKGRSDIYKSIVQLILTIGKARTFDKVLPPAFLGAFDAEKMAFIGYNDIQEIFYQNDFNWNVTPSNYETKEFKQIHEKVKTTIEKDSLLFDFARDEHELKQFIKTNFVSGKSETSRIQIDKNNFISIYNKWLVSVKPSIIISWDSAKKGGIIDGDFYLADLLSNENQTLKEKLYILLKGNYYEVDRKLDQMGMFSSKTANFYDNQKAHTQFWNKYERPPKEEYWDYIVQRRDLLVPQDVRERKGSFFTPQIWVELSQKYLTDVLGEDWQDEYYIWDVAAGTGNLLAGLTNKYNIYASTLDKQDVDVMHQRIDTMNQNSITGHGANLLQDHVFQFDFLNDSFDDPKVPKSLQDILKDPEKRKKLVVYINPPYAEATSGTTITGTGKNKSGVSTNHKPNELYKPKIGNATNEIFALFMARIYDQISGSKLAQFSTLKFVQGSNFKQFRNFFLAKYLDGFVVPADTFDNVTGNFPIGFTIWDLDQKEKIKEISCGVFKKIKHKDRDETTVFVGTKNFYGDLPDSVNKWIKIFDDKSLEGLGYLGNSSPDFQHNSQMYISIKKGVEHFNFYNIIRKNLFPAVIYFSVRHVFEANWLNDRDQFLYPNEGWQTDTEFQNDCLTFALFHGQNRISSNAGVNHWIPFTESEVNSRERFASSFMTDFIKGKKSPLQRGESLGSGCVDSLDYNKTPSVNSVDTFLKEGQAAELFVDHADFIPTKPLQFSSEAVAVFDAGRELWRYYHVTPKIKDFDPLKSGNDDVAGVLYNPNASLYDIREYFQGRNVAGKMNNKSSDEKYNLLIGNLRESLKVLGLKIQPKVYEYGFLRG